jgi:hypothetical protein
MARYRVLTGSGRHMRGYGLERLHSTGSGWATDPSTLLLQILTKVEDESSTKPGHNHKAREYICMHSARIATHYKQSNNHATRYTLEIKSYNMARCTLDT